jgi:S-adenosylmethionine:tRNA ribosyltransferase-isomerase
MPENLRTSDFDFHLPPELVAQTALEPRDHARLLHVRPQCLADHHVYDLPELLRADDLLILNDTRVIPSRLYSKRGDMRVEIFLHKKSQEGVWRAFARPAKRLRIGDILIFAETFTARVTDRMSDGEILVDFSMSEAELISLLHRYGEPPLPPYIKREKGQAAAEKARYQTVYAAHDGAVAAPTAGLHFTPELMTKLRAKGVTQAAVTLHVGAGTFLPVKVEHIKDHAMHAERAEISQATARLINEAKQKGRRVVAVGTTSLRVLESAADEGGIVHPFAQETSIFITPGYRFRAIDVLMTNFHLPQSTLFMLVSAFMGLERMQAAYRHAMQKDYRFYSYGDASLLERL